MHINIDCGIHSMITFNKQKLCREKTKEKINKLLKLILYGKNGTNFGISNNTLSPWKLIGSWTIICIPYNFSEF